MMEKTSWKIIAIIFVILFIVETSFLVLGIVMLRQEQEMMKECYYNICGDYPEAWIEDDICYCYDYDVIGDLIVAKTEIID